MSVGLFFKPALRMTVGEIVALTGAVPREGARLDHVITNVASLDRAGPSDLAFLGEAKYADLLGSTRAGACLTTERFASLAPKHLTVLLASDPYLAFVEVARKLFPDALRPTSLFETAGVALSAMIHPAARIEHGVTIDPGAVIGPRAAIGSGTVIGATAVIGPDVHIGRDCSIGPGATIVHALIGDGVIVHAGCRIGQDGFRFHSGTHGHTKVPQLGRVIIQDNVEIGAGTAIDRGGGADTVIGEGTKIDNLVQIGHHVSVGRNCIIVSQCGLSGGVVLGDNVVLGGQVGIADHFKIGEGAMIGAKSGVISDVPPGEKWFGYPALPGREYLRSIAALRKRSTGTNKVQIIGAQSAVMPDVPPRLIEQSHELVRRRRANEGLPMMLRDIAAALSGAVEGDASIEVAGLADPAEAGPADLALAMTPETVAALERTKARAVVVASNSLALPRRFDALIRVAHPRQALAVLTRLFDLPVHRGSGIHPTAVIAPDAEIGTDVAIGPLAVIGPRACIGPGTAILAHVTVGADAAIGRDCLLHPGVRIGDRVIVGDRAILHHNVSLGADGFSYAAPDPRASEVGGSPGTDTLPRINSLGTVIIEDDVEIGANSAVDRATLRATRIGRNTKIDNLVQIGHNVAIGEDCLICGMVGISGSVKIGDRVVLGGGVGITDHVTIGSDAIIAGGSGVGSNVPAKAVMAGYPAVPRERAFEQIRHLARLRALFAEVGELKKRLAALEQMKQA